MYFSGCEGSEGDVGLVPLESKVDPPPHRPRTQYASSQIRPLDRVCPVSPYYKQPFPRNFHHFIIFDFPFSANITSNQLENGQTLSSFIPPSPFVNGGASTPLLSSSFLFLESLSIYVPFL